MAETSETTGIPTATRRTVVAGVGVAGLAAALTACGGSEDTSSGTGNSGTTPAQGGSSSSAASGGSSGGSGGTELGTTSDIPSGGGKVFEAQKVVVTQPTAGEYKAFSAVCPHQGCLVNQVADGTIDCPCHQSKFSMTDGSRQSGPATTGLTEAKITVEGTSIKLA